jgi:uncharacterized protein YfaS (alpha-2-macroglobulin family)
LRRILVAFLLVLLALVTFGAIPPADTQSRDAERLLQEGSFRLALEAYRKVDKAALPDDEKRWVDFRLADLLWRSDPEQLQEASRKLEALLHDEKGKDIRDRVWAEAHESLADLSWMPRQRRDWSSAWNHYSAALDWWAGSRDVELARARYLAIVFKATDNRQDGYPYGYYASQIPLEILENAVDIATNPNDKAHANYLVATRLSQQRDPESVERARKSFDAAIASGKTSEWHDDALMQYGQRLEYAGTVTYLDDGTWRIEPDYEAALAMYRRILSEYQKGETRFFDQAKERVDEITQPSVGVAVSNVFLPGSKAEFQLQWRNAAEVELSMSKVDLTTDITQWSGNSRNWYDAIDASRGRERFSWKKVTTTKPYVPGAERVAIDRDLTPGAWLLEASAGTRKAREIVLVTDAAIVTRTSKSKTLVWVTDARTGAPRAAANVSLWIDYREQSEWKREQRTAVTDADGVAEISLRAGRSGQMMVFANANGQQSFAQLWGYGGGDDAQQWRIYATTDRPAYRPGETAQWKITARVTTKSGYAVPSARSVKYEIFDPRGSSVSKGTLTLNAFGSAWADLRLDATMPLGEYRVNFSDGDRGIGSAALFRLEEYKLPEFRVAVKTTDDKGLARSFRLGDTVEATIEASYYSGGPVTNATVEAVVYQNPYYRYWFRERDYPWYFNDDESAMANRYRGNGTIVKRVTLTTDGAGRAALKFDTPASATQDFVYMIEARVTDASRREITSSSSIRVTRAPYFAEARPKHWLYRPGDTVDVEFHTADANDQPVQAVGTLRVTREEWKEVWLDPKGNEVTGRQIEALRARGAFPPPAEPGQHPWLLRSRGYEQEEVLKTTVKTDEKGRAVQKFTAAKEGYYRFSWSSKPMGVAKPRPRDVVETSTTVWVASKDTMRIGYFHENGVEILVDEDSVRPGATVPAMIVVPTADRYVLFDIAGDDIMSRQVVHTAGNVKLVELKLGDEHIPNVFLSASMVMDLQFYQDTKEIVVPPVQKFLTVDVKADREKALPREEGTLTITATDADGKPVKAEVSLGVADESVYAIQEDYAGDPRPFFYGQKRSQTVQTASSFMQRGYADLKNEELKQKRGVVGAAVGGVFKAADSVAEMVTVTGSAPAALPPPPAQRMMAKVTANQVTEEPAVVVRTDFRSTVFWKPDVVTDENGKAIVKFTYPDSLTSWRATARAATTASQFGTAKETTRTQKPLIVRLQAPRFFVVGDRTVVSAVVNNNTDHSLTVAPSLDASGLIVAKGETNAITVAPDGEGRVDWIVAVKEPGAARLRVTAKAGELNDAMERTYPVEDHGIDKLIAVSGKSRAAEATWKLEIPRERRSTTMTVQVAPSIAVTMLDALPYLIDYPYGCTEQTMSRFLPTIIVAKTLSDLGISREVVASRLFGGIEKKGKKDLEKLDEMTRAGLARLYDFQHGDGGWGWWKQGDSDHHMTAYVVWGLALARDAGVSVRSDVLDRGVKWLQQELVKEELNPDRQAWMLHALAATAKGRAPEKFEKAAIDNLWNKRTHLSSYGLALFALSVHQFGLSDQAQTLSRNLENGAIIDQAPNSDLATAHWGAPASWWRWYDGPVESTSTALRALSAIDPKHRLIEPSMNWLVKNRRGAQWNNTRDTALAVLALSDYLRSSGELGGDVAYEVSVNGTPVASKTISRAEMLSAPSRFAVPASAIRDGVNLVTVKKTSGSGALYVAAEARFFSLEEPVKAAGNEIYVDRKYEKLTGRPTLLKGYVYDRVPMKDGDSIRSGERVEVVVTVEVKNDYEYLLLEDLKPAGLEALELVSGTPLYARKLKGSGTRWVYQELRDRKVAMFIDKLDQGTWEIRYTLRAEVPGMFHALPLVGGAMYVPEIRGNSDETRITVEER